MVMELTREEFSHSGITGVSTAILSFLYSHFFPYRFGQA